MKTLRLSLLALNTLLILALAACNLPGASGGRPQATQPKPEQPTAGPTSNLPATPQPTKPAAGACANAYYPSAPGATWTYANTSSMAPSSVSTRTISNVSPTGFVTNDVSADIKVAVSWSCKDGNLAMLNSATISAKDVFARAATVTSSGYLVPAAITDGATWSETLNILTTGSAGANTDITQKNDTKIDCTANGKDSVQVKAGKFDALKVTCVYDITATTDMTGESAPGKPVNNTITFTYWYASGVGMVKSDETGDISGGSELVSYSIP